MREIHKTVKRVGKKRKEQFWICVVKGIVETREQTISSRCKGLCSSDVELTALDVDEPGRIKVLKTGWCYREEMVYELYLFRCRCPSPGSPLRVDLWWWIRERMCTVLCFVQSLSACLFLTHAGEGEQAQPPTERGSLRVGAATPVTFFHDTLPNWCHLVKSDSFQVVLLVVLFVAATSSCGSDPW